MSTTTIRVDNANVRAARPILRKLGMTPRGAIDAFLAQVVSRKAIPFPLALPDSDYVRDEYGLTPAETVAAGRRMRRATATARRAGTLRPVSGIDSLRE